MMISLDPVFIKSSKVYLIHNGTDFQEQVPLPPEHVVQT